MFTKSPDKGLGRSGASDQFGGASDLLRTNCPASGILL
jgi:hypothetical protein